MNKDFIFSLLFVCILLCFSHYYKNIESNMVYEKATFDNHEYLVRNVNGKNIAANRLAYICDGFKKLKKHLSKKVDNNKLKKTKNIDLFIHEFDEYDISERTPNDNFTSYTLNKKSIHFCLITRNKNNELHDKNTLMFVALHEVAHVFCKECDAHDDGFGKAFKFILKEAVEAGIYTPQDFRNNPKKYCGIMITDTPLGTEYFE